MKQSKEALGDDFDANPESVAAYDGEDGKGRFYVVALEVGGYVVASGGKFQGRASVRAAVRRREFMV